MMMSLSCNNNVTNVALLFDQYFLVSSLQDESGLSEAGKDLQASGFKVELMRIDIHNIHNELNRIVQESKNSNSNYIFITSPMVSEYLFRTPDILSSINNLSFIPMIQENETEGLLEIDNTVHVSRLHLDSISTLLYQGWFTAGREIASISHLNSKNVGYIFPTDVSYLSSSIESFKKGFETYFDNVGNQSKALYEITFDQEIGTTELRELLINELVANKIEVIVVFPSQKTLEILNIITGNVEFSKIRIIIQNANETIKAEYPLFGSVEADIPSTIKKALHNLNAGKKSSIYTESYFLRYNDE